MALPSQSGQPKSRRSYMYRRKRGRRKYLLLTLLVLLGITVTVWAVKGKSLDADSSEAQAGDIGGETARETELDSQRLAANTPAQTDAQSSPTSNSSPPVIRMGDGPQSSSMSTEPDRSGTSTASRTGSSSSSQPTTPAERQDPTPPAPHERETHQQPVARDTTTPPPPAEHPFPAVSAAERERALQRLRAGMDLLQSNRPIEARWVLSQALASNALSRSDARRVREVLTELNDRLVFSPEVVRDDPFAYGYAIRPGDFLSRIASRENLHVDWRFIQRINRIPKPEQIRAGQNLKLIKGPFHAIVSKRDFRMDIYLGEGSDQVFIRSFSVGLGEYNSTPIGTFRVRPNSKLINPEWVNPRTRERYLPDDPNNPIGDFWIGLEGTSEAVRDLDGYGIHGTIEPDSIGKQASMGCVRLLPDDIALVFELLVESESTVIIRD